MAGRWRVLLRVTAALLGTVFLVLAAPLVFLQSERGSRWALDKTKEILATRFHIQFQASSWHLEALHGVSVRDLHLVVDRPDMQADVRATRLDLKYSIHLFSRLLEIHDFLADHPVVRLKMQSTGAPGNESADGGGAPTDFGSVLRDPPVKIELKQARVIDLDAEIEKSDSSPVGTGHLELALRKMNFEAEFTLLPARFASRGKLSVDPSSRIKIESGSGAPPQPTSHLSLGFAPKGQWELDVHENVGRWLYSLNMQDMHLGLSNILMQSVAAQSSTRVEIPRVDCRSSLRLGAQTKEFARSEPDALSSFDLQGEISAPGISFRREAIGGKTDTAKTAPMELRAAQSRLRWSTELGRELSANFRGTVEKVTAPSLLKRPIGVELKLNSVVPRDLQKSAEDLSFAVDGRSLLALRMETAQAADFSRIEAKGHADLSLERALAKIVAALAKLEQTGSIHTGIDFDVIREATGDARVQLRAHVPEVRLPLSRQPFAVTLATDLKLNPVLTGVVADGVGVVGFSHDLTLQNADYGKWQVQTNLRAENAMAGKGADQARNIESSGWWLEGKTTVIELTPGRPEVVPVRLDGPLAIEHKIDLRPASRSADAVLLAPGVRMVAGGGLRDSRLHARLALPTADGSVVVLEQLELSVEKGAVRASASGRADLNSKDAHAEVNLAFAPPANFPDVAGQRLRGSFKVPLILTLRGGREVTVDGRLRLQDVSWKKGNLSATDINGDIPFAEKLLWTGEALRFHHVITQNPFERVDFERVRPLLQGATQLKVGHFGWEEKIYGPFRGFLSLRQNILSVHQFDVDLLSGRMYGEMFLDVLPENLEFGVLSRVTGFELGELLPAKFLARLGKSEKRISGRTGMVINLSKRSIDGRMDVTEIGGAQLVALINVLDPAYEDQKMNKVRNLLAYGFPTSVSLAFDEGYMNMDIGLSLLGVPQTQRLYAIPVANLLAPTMAGIVQQAKKGPIR